MAMRDDCWPAEPDDTDPERSQEDAEEARVYDILRRALSSSPSDAPTTDPTLPADQSADTRPYTTSLGVRSPLPSFATYRRLIEHMTHREGFTSGAVCVPARFAPQLIMQMTSAGLRATGQRTPTRAGAPPMVRIHVYAPQPPQQPGAGIDGTTREE